MKMLIGGEWIDRDEKIEVKNPQDGEVIDTVPAGDREDVEKVYQIAEKGAEKMEELSTYDRYTILNETAERLEEKIEEFAILMAKEGVKTIREARSEVKRAVDTLKYTGEEAKRFSGELMNIDGDYRRARKLGWWVMEPAGIVLAITPYNDPLNMVVHKLSPAFAAGNSAVLKPTYLTPLTALKFGGLLLESGLPEEALSIITGYSAAIGDALVEDKRPRVITFTGGVKAGERIIRKAGIKRVMMELGSSSAVIVLDDVDLDSAVPAIVSGSFWAAGQDCIGVQRIYIKENIFDDFIEKFIPGVEKLKVGDKLDEETDVGPMITESEADRVEEWIREAIEGGAELMVGGKREGNYIYPTVLKNPSGDAKVIKGEVFGPVVSVIPVRDLNEGIERSNDTEFGLHGAIFTRDIEKALYASRKLKFGGVMINDSTDFRVDYMPFGGFKKSGVGREGPRFAMEFMSEKKLITVSKGDIQV